jgi:hypothetical protein
VRGVKDEDLMIVTSLSALAVSVRSTLARARSSTVTPSPSAASATRVPAPADSVQLSGHAVTLVKALDADGDGLVTKDEFTEGAIELFKRASVRFHHQRIGRGEGIEPRQFFTATDTATGAPTPRKWQS